ncbi:MAG: lipoprotein-releasing system transmembrane subunit LolC [Candidatus Pelagibacter sp.]|nr:lipoprotein-releasing system transmembrane subunit LolC [Candidatus Pelagibacter sp.]
MFNKVERLISARNLKPKKKEGFLKVISIFSFLGIMLGVAILIIVMSVMNGFRTDLTNKILGLNPHIIINPFETKINDQFLADLKNKYQNFKIKKFFSGEGIVITNDLAKGILIKGVDASSSSIQFLEQSIVKGKYENFKQGTIVIGNELANDLNVQVGNRLNLTSSAFIGTPVGNVPKQEVYEVSAIFNTGFYDFDQNIAFLNLSDTLSFFDKSKKDLSVEIYIEDALKADFYKNEIKKINNDYYIYSWTDLNKSFFNALKVERNVMFIILTLIIVVAAFNIISGITILIKNKTKEIAILKILGLSDQSITKAFFLTGFTIGFLASVTGVVFGIIFSFYIEEIRYFLSSVFNLELFPAEIYFLDKMPSEISFSSTFLVFVSSLIISAIASFFPAKLVSKMNTIHALKYE